MQNKITKTTERTADQAYAEKRQNIIALAAQLGALVQAHQTGSVDWGHVGDLAEIESKLQEAVGFLNG